MDEEPAPPAVALRRGGLMDQRPWAVTVPPGSHIAPNLQDAFWDKEEASK